MPAARLGELFDELVSRRFEVIGPTLRDGAIGLAPLRGVADLPQGWTHDTGPGRYELRRRPDAAYFGYVVSSASAKRWVHPVRELLWKTTATDEGVSVSGVQSHPARLALVGLRGCDVSGLAVLGGVLGGDTRFAARRDALLVVAVDCVESASTCFCASMGTGPGVDSGFDIALTELLEPEHVFVVRIGSERGGDLLAVLDLEAATAAEIEAVQAGTSAAAASQTRRVIPQGARRVLERSVESARWSELDERCLACGNCTLVCPTCFCVTVEASTSLDGSQTQYERRWDSCFSSDFSYMHGGPVRRSRGARYRQWITHKLSSWYPQFGQSGCVGCGRCITYCPVGIDIVAEAQRFTDDLEHS